MSKKTSATDRFWKTSVELLYIFSGNARILLVGPAKTQIVISTQKWKVPSPDIIPSFSKF
ncbi:hypothetical protein V1477_007256 [Vespula maculifrons]|uniref:Uncharacterized protein n=1 Tax=Vespula maculifrons TaxID=7453 RepID=A0ABD2CI05_VESMC